MSRLVSPKCPSCGAAVDNPRLVRLPVMAYGAGWMTDAAPLAVGFQCGCGVLLPLTAYPPAAQGRPVYRA
jgi:hypothetical protein